MLHLSLGSEGNFMPVLGVLNSTECGGLHDKAAVDVH